MCHRHLRDIAFTSVRSVSPCAHYISLLIYPPYFGRAFYYPVTMSSITLLPCLLLLCYHVLHYSVTMSPITLYHVLNILLPCLLLPCTISPITLLPYLLLPCYHVLHYPVSSRNAKPQKRVDKLIIPRSHTPQNN